MAALVPVTLPESQHQLWVPVFQQGNQFSRPPFFLPDESSVRGSWRHRWSFSPRLFLLFQPCTQGSGNKLAAPHCPQFYIHPTLRTSHSDWGDHLELWDPAVSESAPRQYQAQPKDARHTILGPFSAPREGPPAAPEEGRMRPQFTPEHRLGYLVSAARLPASCRGLGVQ